MKSRFNSIRAWTRLLSLSISSKSSRGSPKGVSRVRTNLSELRSYANSHFASKIAQKEQEEENNFYRVREPREDRAESQRDLSRIESPRKASARIGFAAAGRDSALDQADDDRILARQKAASSWLPTQPEQPRTIGDGEQKNQRGGTPT
jgi:hypothetical protein